MSKENNARRSSLCTTEDAFEQFQSVVMYEDEFITLSDIVPPQPVVPDISNELKEIPYDNEVVLCSTSEDAQGINTTVVSSFGRNNERGSQCLDETKNNASKTHAPKPLYFNEREHGTPGTTNVSKKRGRKKTKSIETRISNQKVVETDSNTLTGNQAIQDSVLSTTVGKNDTDSNNDTLGESSYPRRTRRERIPNTAKYPPLSPESVLNNTISNKITPAKKRGRPKKIPLEHSTIPEPDSTNIDNASLVRENLSCPEGSELDDASKQKTIQRCARGRPKKSSTLSHVKEISNSSNKSTENNTDMPVRDIKKPTRSGYQKLSEANVKSSESIGNSDEANEHNKDFSMMDFQSEDNELRLNEPVKNYNDRHPQIDAKCLDSNTVKKPSKQGKKKKCTTKCNDSNSKEKMEESFQESVDNVLKNDDDDADDICLSKLKENVQNDSEDFKDNISDVTVVIQNISNTNDGSSKRSSKVPLMADFEYNIDKVGKEASLDDDNEVDTIDNSLLIEDTSKRPYRRKAQQSFKYDEDSEEDPFANIELSDDDEPKHKKKGRYASDDEYLPRKKRGKTPVTSSSDSDIEINDDMEEGKIQKRKKIANNSDNQTPRKRGRKKKAEKILNKDQEGDTEEPSVITDEPLSMKPPAEAWATSNEFENFIAQKIGTNLKIKKVSSKQKTENVVSRLEIPVIDQNERKKMTETSIQTSSTPTTSTGVQTCVPYDIPMKTVLNLTSEQSEKACEFLNSVVKTTAELGQLMKVKSEDFMNKKINTENVTDTFKMDYCVRKSFLLFKLAKHNLIQMEEDLAHQYDKFLKNNGLSSCREELKSVTPKTKPKPQKADSDSDCEIVDVKEIPKSSTQKETPKFNPKTVFLNKELSIKIAKKPSADKNIDIKGRHTVWINDSVMVKKVKPTQSFLAQDSRNKKPPDCVTDKMVSDFFKNYYHQKAIAVCAPYINTEWSSAYKEYACYYFVKCNDLDGTDIKNAADCMNMVDNDASTSNGSYHDITGSKEIHKNNPKSLVSLCTKVVSDLFHYDNIKEVNEELICNLTDGKNKNQPLTLFRLCIQSLTIKLQIDMSKKSTILNKKEERNKSMTVLPLQTLCYQRIAELMPLFEKSRSHFTNINGHTVSKDVYRETNTVSNVGTSDKKDVNIHISDEGLSPDTSVCEEQDLLSDRSHYCEETHVHKNGTQSLLSLCVKSIQNTHGGYKKPKSVFVEDIEKIHSKIKVGLICPKLSSPDSLKYIMYECIKHFIYPDKLTDCVAIQADTYQTEEIIHSNENTEDFTINCINTMSEEAFHSLEQPNDLQDDYDNEPGIEDFGEVEVDGNEWASQVQMQELRSCATPVDDLPANEYFDTIIDNSYVASPMNTTENEFIDTNIEHDELYQNTEESIDGLLPTTQIKLEPLDFIIENVDSSIVKTEPVLGLDGMTIIPESIVTKTEIIDHGIEIADLVEKESSAFDVNSFEKFVKTNKMRSVDEYSDSEEMFSQSGLRIRRQHEPDYDAENDMNMSLLIPHTFEPLHIESAKGDLMESSDEGKNSGAKKTGRKKREKKKAKLKKTKDSVRKSNNKEIVTIGKGIPLPLKEISANLKEKAESVNEVAILTRRMREKIRQEEKKIESSDSETDDLSLIREINKKGTEKKCEGVCQEEKKVVTSDWEIDHLCLSLRRTKNKKETEKNTTTKNLKQGEASSGKAVADNEIQCNNVDSTEQILENKDKSIEADQFTGFSPMDQNEISNYEKYMKLVYDKILPEDDESTQENASSNFDEDNFESNRSSPLINPDDPVELLECEPTVPIFDYGVLDKAAKRLKKTVGKKKYSKQETLYQSSIEKEKTKFTDRHGWHCYSYDPKNVKSYKSCYISLEKLPESFVETYLQYHDITDRDNIDKEVDRLVNLQSLNRATCIKEGKGKNRQKGKSSNYEEMASEQISRNDSRVPSPADSDRLDELTASEDEAANVDDELPPPVSMRNTENYIAKNFLMGENESDSDGDGTKKIKEELNDTDQVVVKHKPGPKSKVYTKAKADTQPSKESLMLTADKMMNKELSFLNAPTVHKEEIKDTPLKEPSSKEESKAKKKNAKNVSLRDRLKNEDDSSSEEEKQWVSTKEKLLKRLGKKEHVSLDDAKRAKLVDDFIEKRGDEPGKRRAIGTSGGRRSKKKFLERMKQQRVLSKELYGEPDALPGGKRGAAGTLFKGRRNIRKVIDKKSLQKSTVLANMEEFERKRRLNSKQNQLRELLDCEEGVNVLVINDEVCLEYDFREQRPVVTVHPFFTKVMKAHQYEGVKFMWDACFESLEVMEAGRPGGGCILAHCMGLGKTLQVLALLHTVLTHPRAGIHRVLVCCPLSTVLNWVDEIHKWIGPVTDQIKVFELSKLKKTYERAYQLEDWYSGGGIFIIGYELFRSLTTLDPQIDEIRPTIINKIRTALLDPGPDIIICDEGHLLKNDCSVLAVAMSRVVTRRRIVLTGTPMQNNLREYYCMVNFVKPNLLGTYSEYSNRFENPIMNGQHRDSLEEDIKLMKARTHILHKVLEGCLQRQEASVLYPYLPKKHEYTVFIPLTKCQWDLYKHYVHHYTKKSKQSVLKDFHILQKIWSHPQVLHNFQIKSREEAKKKEIKAEKLEDDLALEDKEDIKPTDTGVWWLEYLADGAMLNSLESSNKFVAVFRILHECIALGDKVLIFSTSLFCLDALEYFLKQINGWSLGQEYFRLDGSVPVEVRQKWCREYNAENNVKTKLFLISTRAGCLGLNMTAANRVIILDTSWNPAHDIQSIFRVYRFGQKKDCYIYRLVAMGTMEQKIYERSVTKQAVACRVVDEQQIDRHYNMAELTELYRFDEFGAGVAGGVAVGVGDVALLRVARDAAVHAVHEHDSLLRGSGEQGLPEHERAAAWMQFQQEHANKQMQNDLETDLAAQALKKEQERELIQQQLAQQRAQVHNIKTEDGPVHDNLLVPRPAQPSPGGRGGSNIVQYRIPIGQPEAGPSHAPEPLSEEEMVRQISNLLIKHNFTSGRGPKQIKDLVAKVKNMIQTSKPLELGQNDELTTSIAKVLLRRQGSAPAPTAMPALTDISPEEPRRSRRRPRKYLQNEPASALPTPPPVVNKELEYEVSGRRRRKAAIAAERQFDLLEDGASQDSAAANAVIELDDDDWNAAGSETDSAPEFAKELAKEQKPPEAPKKTGRRRIIIHPNAFEKSKEDDSSILLSDDEAPLVVKPQANPAEEIIPLHPSLLTNENFIKIVAHTYLAGNPMLDEDAATLAAQYSAFRLLKETGSTGKPIESGPIYDIAIKVLGKEVLRKLQTADPKTKDSARDSNAASSKLMKLLVQEPAAASKPGPKSRVKQKEIKQEKEMPKLGIPQVVTVPHNSAAIVPIKLLRRSSAAVPTAAPAAADECILPDDDEDVRCVTDAPPPAATTHQPAKPGPLKLKLRLVPMKKDQDSKPKQTPSHPAIRIITGGAGTAAAPTISNTYDTISLDSDEDEPPAAPAPAPVKSLSLRSLRAGRLQALTARGAAPAEGPVPVALTGPNSQPLPLAPGLPAAPASAAPTSLPSYSFSSEPSIYTDPVPVSLTGPDSRPVPISLTGPDSRPVPISLTGPGFQAIPISMAGPGFQGIPASYATTGVPMSFETVAASYGGDAQSGPMTFTVADQSGGGVRPVAMSYVGGAGPGSTQQPISLSTSGTPGEGGVQKVRLASPGQVGKTGTHGGGGGGVVHQVASNIFLMPAAAAGNRLLTRVPASQVPLSQRLEARPLPVSQASKQMSYAPIFNTKMCKPGDILRLTKTGQLEVLSENSSDLIHTIDDDEPLAQPTPKGPTNAATPKAQTPNQFTSKVSLLTALGTKPAVQPISKPAPQSALKPAPHPVSKPALQPVSEPALQLVSKPAPVSVSKPARQSVSKSDDTDLERSHRSRKISSSSSSSSDSSRSPSPDPLSILKDVVHIQAPERQRSRILTPTPRKPEITIPKQPMTNQGISKVIPRLGTKTTPSSEKTKHKDDAIAIKLNTILASVKSMRNSVSKNKSAQNIPKATNSKAAVATIKDSIDLTEIPCKPFKSGDTSKSNPKGKSTSTSKKDSPSTVMGTSKNIVLDVKTKSLTNKSTVDITGQKSVQVMNVKTIAPSTSKQKPPEKKRHAPQVEASAPKKKKTELMTLKDFDLDDIDDIIELE